MLVNHNCGLLSSCNFLSHGDCSRHMTSDYDSMDIENRLQMGHRIGEVSDMTGPALFLASDAAKFVTGLTIPVDGGRSAFGDYYMNADLFKKD